MTTPQAQSSLLLRVHSPSPRALSFPTHHPMLDITLDGPTPCAFIFPSARPPLTPPEPSPSTPSISSSLFDPERPGDTPLKSSTTTAEFTAPLIARSRSTPRISTQANHSRSLHAVAVHPSFLSYCYSLITLNSSHRHNLNLHNLLDFNSHTHAIQLAGTERRPKRGNEDYIKRPENAFFLL
ncbi:uncharacterized protein FOMMEDRAFT_163562 [Fomitiporia mediterranea MF3/22]|uniref:Uncharacterized protein n=1 Tax=Fomitiporia mediterranea (strain MF3/22) TaxID=694068 RepID=R7SGH7_FOMME|nr:uncharacterized protein FOMMEDRAFT_163562 [Fomitiporia mediterranea MF3/22]EJC97402.1 hypothetical protein FOMMEDRAFT_163562 [Fomitiporia mediterranea MF3/22]